MKFYYSPGACSIGIHVILEEVGAVFEPVISSTRDGTLYRPDYTSVNPKSKVPALARDDGSVLTEFPAIAFWLGRSFPQAGLIPPDVEGEARVLEAMEYICGTVHMQGFARLFRTVNFTPDEAGFPAVRARGHEIIAKAMGLLDAQLAGRDWLVGSYSVADSALFFLEMWGKRAEITLPANVAGHFQRMLGRPAVQRVLAREGLSA